MSSSLTRRSMMLIVSTAPLVSQTTIQAPAAEPHMQKAQADVKEVSDKLAAIEVPVNIEPSFRFSV